MIESIIDDTVIIMFIATCLKYLRVLTYCFLVLETEMINGYDVLYDLTFANTDYVWTFISKW